MQLPNWVPLNSALLFNPVNWAVVISMAAVAFTAFALVSERLNQMQSQA